MKFFLLILCLFYFLNAAPAQAQCANPVANAGDAMYNKDFSTLQYCDGTNHIGMGRAPGTGACAIGLTEVGSVSTANLNSAFNLAVSGNYAYVVSANFDRFTIIDISNPAAPFETGSLSTANLDSPRDVAISGNYAYVASVTSDSLTIIDISNPAAPSETGSISNAFLNGAQGVAVSGNYAYVTVSVGDRLTIIDISNPAAPSQTGTISSANMDNPKGVAISGNYAYVAGAAADSLTIIDISNPAAPSETGTISSANLDFAQDVVVSGNYAYVASVTSDSLTIIDISNPAAPSETGSISTANLNGATGVGVSGNSAYVSSAFADSLTIIDISNPAAPSETGSISTANLDRPEAVAISGNYLYVASSNANSLTIVEETCTPSEGLVGYWRLDETSGTTAVDSSFNTNNGTMQGGLDAANDSVTGPIDGALNFDGVDDIIVLPDVLPDGQTEVSASVWIYTNGFSGVDFEEIFDQVKDAGGDVIWGFYHSPGGAETRWQIRNSADVSVRANIPDASFPLNQWNHLVGTYDGSNIRIYLNGVEIDSQAQTGALFNSSMNVGLGNKYRDGAPSGSSHFEGGIDDVRLYDRALSVAEITRLYNAGRDRGLIGHWKLDETGATTTAVDSSVNGNDGTMTGGLSGTDSVTGKIDTALDFDGNDRVDIGNVSSIKVNYPITFSAWIQNTETDDSVVVGSSYNPWNHLVVVSSGAIRLSIETTSTGVTDIDSTTLVNDGVWHHVAGTYDGTTMRIFVDGIEEASVGKTGDIDYDSDTISIGQEAGSSSSETFTGQIDDVRIYGRALSPDDIQALYREKFILCDSPLGYEGEIIYNDDNDVMQFCDSQNWKGMGPAGDGGAGCSNPTGAAGDMIYNDGASVMTYCEGDAWIAIGK